MSRSIALLTIVAFALSAPLNARTLLAPADGDESITATNAPIDSVRPECLAKSAQGAAGTDATGGLPDTEASAAEAQVTACCWIYAFGRWWCMSC
jgi:hypothetical protein